MIEAMSPNAMLKIRQAVEPAEAPDSRRHRSTTRDHPTIEGLGETMSAVLRKLTAADAEMYQTLRLEGLASHPSDFGAAHEEEVGHSFEEVGRQLDRGFVFGAFVGSRLYAIAGFRRFERIKKRHKSELFGVYVDEAARGQGLGERLLRHLIARAADECELLLATVASSNLQAKALYAKLGFEIYGHETHAHKVDGRYVDQDHLVLILR